VPFLANKYNGDTSPAPEQQEAIGGIEFSQLAVEVVTLNGLVTLLVALPPLLCCSGHFLTSFCCSLDPIVT
jgi:hypothetical protein